MFLEAGADGSGRRRRYSGAGEEPRWVKYSTVERGSSDGLKRSVGRISSSIMVAGVIKWRAVVDGEKGAGARLADARGNEDKRVNKRVLGAV